MEKNKEELLHNTDSIDKEIEEVDENILNMVNSLLWGSDDEEDYEEEEDE